jgi:xanthine dehydrogenase YagS FAD-binding subunit
MALAAIDALVEVEGPEEPCDILFLTFPQLPDNKPKKDNMLHTEKIISTVRLLPVGFSAHHSYLKLRNQLS